MAFSSAGVVQTTADFDVVDFGCFISSIELVVLGRDRTVQRRLSQLSGASVFAYLHYFVGSLVTSLPELTVAVRAFRRSTSPSANLALAGTSVSNATNLAIAMLGILLALLFQISGE